MPPADRDEGQAWVPIKRNTVSYDAKRSSLGNAHGGLPSLFTLPHHSSSGAVRTSYQKCRRMFSARV